MTIDLRGRSAMADHMVIASGRSARQVGAIAEKLADRMKQATGRTPRIEGKDTGDWVLIDTDDVIVHVFRPAVREFSQLEKLWMPSDALVRVRDQARPASFGEVVGEPVNAIAENGIPVRHDQRRRAGVNNSARSGEDVLEACPALERDVRRVRDDRAVHERVGVGHADLDDVRSGLDEGDHRLP